MLIIRGSFRKQPKHLVSVSPSTLTGTPNLPISFSVVGTTTVSSGSFPNAGVRYFQTIGQNIGDYVGAEGWSQPFAESLHTGTISWQTDLTAPFSSSHVMTVTLKSGTYIGTPEPWLGEIDFQSSSKKQALYYVMLFKLNSNFQGHTSSNNKITYIWSNAATSSLSSGGQILMEPLGSGSNPLFPRLFIQGGTADSRDANNGGTGALPLINSSYQITKNKWVRWEVFAQMNSYNLSTNTYNNDGIIQSWITTEGETIPTQLYNVTDVKWDAFHSGGATFTELQSLYLYGGNGTSSLFADNQIEYSRCEVYTGPAIFTTTSFIATFNTASSPHASWAEFGYTDFRLQYVPGGNTSPITGQALTESIFLAGHMDSIMSGVRPAGGIYDSVGLDQIPYTLLYNPKIYDNATDIFVAYWRDAQSWSLANNQNEEDLYLHRKVNQAGFKYPIQFISSSGLLQTTYSDPTAFVSVSQVYITGTNNINLDGTHSISGYSYTPVISQNLAQGTLQFFIDTVGFNLNGVGTVQPPPGDGTRVATNRVVSFNNGFPPPFWPIAPATSASHTYHLYRLNRLMSSSYGGLASGIFIDVMQSFTTTAIEYSSSIANQYYYDMANLLTAIRLSFAPNKNIVRINVGNYTIPTTSILLTGSLNTHMEQTNNPRHAFWFSNVEGGGFTKLSSKYGVLIELVNAYAWSDNISGGGGNYVNDYKPDGAFNITIVRQKITEYANYLTCLYTSSVNGLITGSSGNIGGVICALWNDSWAPLNSISGSVIDRWLPIFEFPLGKQLNDLYTIINGKVDNASQTAVVRQMDFQSCSIFLRGTDDYTTTNFGDGAIYSFPLPISSGSTGQWKRIQSDGLISASILISASLRPAEAIFLVPV